MDTDSDSKAEGNSILVAYFSLAGEQYGVGVIEEGNTAVIAKMIAEQTGADVFEIEAVNAYPETYDGLLDVSRQEMSDNARPEIAGMVDNMEDYDIVFVGKLCSARQQGNSILYAWRQRIVWRGKHDCGHYGSRNDGWL